MKPIVLIHGYSSEGKDNTFAQIYGTLPDDLRQWVGADQVKELDLSRWISLNDGIALDDISLAMNRALSAECPELLTAGFQVIIHSTGALVVRNWIKKFSPKPCPIDNLIHLAGANFGSGLAHIGKGQLARWGRQLALGTNCGYRVLTELEFGSSKTLDLHLHFLQEGSRMYEDYQVQEFCLIGSQIPTALRLLPIRYTKEDSSDCTVRTASGNLNFTHLTIKSRPEAIAEAQAPHQKLMTDRLAGKRIMDTNYELHHSSTEDQERLAIPFAVVYETAHFSDKIGIVTGSQNRNEVMPLIKAALDTPYDRGTYANTGKVFAKAHANTFLQAAKLKWRITEWNQQAQYEGHAQIIFRLRDQNGEPVEHFDIFLNSKPEKNKPQVKLETLIEDKHLNQQDKGTITFYLRTQKFCNKESNIFAEQLSNIAPLDLEITGHEPLSNDISYLPINIRLSPEQIRATVKTFQTTVVDVILLRLPSAKVFEIRKQTR
ncbi:MAG: hypothetical protein KKB30_04045 [Proteobacteria bacterium]|nr:hypothetical protein [Pseudomonadota bacterium]MBU1714905.1 hypothetical protein [Pseudomonadota bacterium]